MEASGETESRSFRKKHFPPPEDAQPRSANLPPLIPRLGKPTPSLNPARKSRPTREPFMSNWRTYLSGFHGDQSHSEASRCCPVGRWG